MFGCVIMLQVIRHNVYEPSFRCYQKVLLMVISVYLPVRPTHPSHPFHKCPWHRIIMQPSGVISIDKSDAGAKDQGRKSKVKITEPKYILPQSRHFRAITPIWIHIRQPNDAQSFVWQRKNVLWISNSSIKFQSHTRQKITNFDPNWELPSSNSILIPQTAPKLYTKLVA